MCNQCLALKKLDESLEMLLKQTEALINDELMSNLPSAEGLPKWAPKSDAKGRQNRKAQLETKNLGDYKKLQTLFNKYNEHVDNLAWRSPLHLA